MHDLQEISTMFVHQSKYSALRGTPDGIVVSMNHNKKVDQHGTCSMLGQLKLECIDTSNQSRQEAYDNIM